jgi:hypothetical protein
MSAEKKHLRLNSSAIIAIAIGLSAPFYLASRASAQFLTSGEGVSFDQVDYDNADGGTADPDSATGEVSVNVSQALTDAGYSSSATGYLNIADASGNWLVQNVPMNSELGQVSTDFDLETPDGQADGSTNAVVEVTPSPVASFAPGNSNEANFSITEETEEDAEGKGATFSATVAPNLAQVSFTVGGTTTGIGYQFNHQNVQAACNQCVPAAYANGLTWLNSTYSLPNLGPNVPGRGNANAQNGYLANTVYIPNGLNPDGMGNYHETAGASLVGSLDLTMNRVSTLRVNGPGVASPAELNGLTAYANNVGDANLIKVYQQNQAQNGVVNGVTVVNSSATDNATFLINSINSGYAVQLGYSGHEVSVIGGGYVLGVPWIAYVSDHLQTNQGDPGDSLLGTPNTANNLGGVDFAWLVKNGAGNYQLVGQAGTPTFQDDSAIQVIPEPASISLLAAGGLFLLKRKRRNA